MMLIDVNVWEVSYHIMLERLKKIENSEYEEHDWGAWLFDIDEDK